MIHNAAEALRAARGGAISGAIAGGLLTTMMTGMSIVKGNDVWYGIKGAAAPFLGNRALIPGFDALPVVLGLASHLVVSMAWGVLFGLAVFRLHKGATVAAGILFSFVVWAGMYFVVLPVVGLAHVTHEAPIERVIVYHLVFAVPLSVAFLPFQPRPGEKLVFKPRPRLQHTQVPMRRTG